MNIGIDECSCAHAHMTREVAGHVELTSAFLTEFQGQRPTGKHERKRRIRCVVVAKKLWMRGAVNLAHLVQ